MRGVFFMRKSILLCAVIAALTLSLTGCGLSSQYANFENSAKLRVGMTKEQVLAVMGKPLDAVFAKPDVWYYYIETRWHDGQETIDECMPVVFKNGKLAGWGNDYYKKEKLFKKQYDRPQIEGLK